MASVTSITSTPVHFPIMKCPACGRDILARCYYDITPGDTVFDSATPTLQQRMTSVRFDAELSRIEVHHDCASNLRGVKGQPQA